MEVLAFWLLLGPTLVVTALTLLPLWKSPAWWVRGGDFPRLQFACLALALVVLDLALLGPADPAAWLLASLALGCFLYQGWWILPYLPAYPNEVGRARAADPAATLSVMAANVLMTNRDAGRLLGLVRAYRPDVLIALETDKWWEEQLDALSDDYPHAVKCPQDNYYGMLVYSHLPLEDAERCFLVEPDIPSVHAAVVLRSGARVRLHALHPAPPAPSENEDAGPRDAELVVVGKSLADADLPVVVAGDLNDVAWSATTRLFRRISGLLDPRVGRGMYNTFHARYPFFRWPLDHLFHSRHWTLVRLERLGHIGSDHFPIFVELALEPGRAAEQEGEEADTEDEERAREKADAEGAREEEVPRPGE